MSRKRDTILKWHAVEKCDIISDNARNLKAVRCRNKEYIFSGGSKM